jgi:hypothetical protein
MNRKILKMMLVLTVFTLFVSSSSMMAAESVPVEETEDLNMEPLMVQTLDVGQIHIGENFINFDVTNHYDVDLGSGGDLIIKCRVKFRLGGWCDHGYACLGYWDENAWNHDPKDCDNEGESRDAVLQFTISNCKPGDKYKIELWARYTDCMNDDFDDRRKSTITIYKEPDPQIDVDPGTVNIQVHGSQVPGEATGCFRVLNTGGKTLDWTITKVTDNNNYVRPYQDLWVSPRSGCGVTNGNPDTVAIKFYVPRWVCGDDFRWTITIDSNTGQPPIQVGVNINVGVVIYPGVTTNFLNSLEESYTQTLINEQNTQPLGT